MTDIVTGDDISLAVQLTVNDVPFVIDPAATVKAALINIEHSKKLSPEAACVENASGADWSTSLVVVIMTSEQTTKITHTGTALFEIQVLEGGKRSTFFSDSVNIINDLIK